MDWIEGIRSYIQVVDQGSFKGAAMKLNTTSSAISKRVHSIEQRLGVQLLLRTTRSVTQTEAGALFYQRSKAQLDSWQSIVDETRSINQAPVGLLKIGASLAVGSKFLVQHFDEFLRQYPDIRIQLITTTPGQLPELSLDLFISREIEQLNSLSFIAKPLFSHQAGFYASPSYIKKYGKPENADDLTDHNVLIWGDQPNREVTLSRNKRLHLSGNFSTTNPEALFYAGKSGMGVLLTNNFMIKEELNSGALVRVLPDITVDEGTLFAYYPKLEYQHTRTELFINYLRGKLETLNKL
ncbi:LysR family transcriptional regulator [Vibrio sp. ZSDE26]|uniref:LysR family transcriptional regulator n=1 Tax=Vibrio amylolyticus TaxID=2847292 RepID=A0A9X2BIE5_9VIBR|nr:LysR family transcriptional regulator [Vibrio amylolyticus]MCK6264020.1 LysR family transcriptional regulator [Vibrio amylolyticus]